MRDSEKMAVAILPFAYRGGGDHAYLAEGMVDLLAAGLRGAEAFRPIDPHAVLARLRDESLDARTVTAGQHVAATLAAQYFVLGSVVEVAGDVRISASLYHRDRQNAVGTLEAGRPADDLMEAVERVAAGLLVQLPGAPGGRVATIAAATSSSLPALKAYLEGETALRAREWGRAASAFDEAVVYDTTFALAYYRLAMAAEWSGQCDRLLDAREAAHRHRTRVPAQDQAVIDAYYVGGHPIIPLWGHPVLRTSH